MAEKVTIMRLKVDLQCSKCTKKVKKVLCEFPQVRAKVFDDKNNIVTITVVCCSPKKIRDKLCCKGGGAIKSIEIVEPKKPDAGDKPKDKDKPDDKPKNKLADKPTESKFQLLKGIRVTPKMKIKVGGLEFELSVGF